MGLSIAMNHCGVLRKITGFFERHECGYWCLRRPRAIRHASIDQGLDHRFVGVAFLALVGEHALAGEARRLVGETTVGIDRVGDVVSMPRSARRGEFAIQTSKSSRP